MKVTMAMTKTTLTVTEFWGLYEGNIKTAELQAILMQARGS